MYRNPNRIRVLLIEANVGDAKLVTEYLTEDTVSDFVLCHVVSLAMAMEKLAAQEVDVTLVDLCLPDANGLEVVHEINLRFPAIPILIHTGLENEKLALAAIETGAQDFLQKGKCNGQALAQAIRFAIQRKRAVEHYRFQATHDPLTKLPNRVLLKDRLQHSIERADRHLRNNKKNWHLAVMLFDLDHFKDVNDTYGHLFGDQLLKSVANRLIESFRKPDTIARFGGDEFVVIFEGVKGRKEAINLAEKLRETFTIPFLVEGRKIFITSSIGVACFPESAMDADELIRIADLAMYTAKQKRNSFAFS